MASKERAVDHSARSLPEYAVVVLYYKLGDRFELTLEALSKVNHAPREVLVVDNSPGDRLAEPMARTHGASYIKAETNLGYAGGMNLGIGALQSDAPYVLMLTHEVILEPHTPRELLLTLHEAPGIAGPVLRRERDGSTWSAGGSLDRLGRASHRTDLPASDTAVEWVDGACVMSSRAVLEQLDGFDESFFLYWEDVDLCYRARQSGIPVTVGHRAVASQETSTVPAYYQARNHVRFWITHRRPTKVVTALLIQVWKLSREILRGDTRDVRNRIAGLRDGVRGGHDARLAR